MLPTALEQTMVRRQKRGELEHKLDSPCSSRDNNTLPLLQLENIRQPKKRSKPCRSKCTKEDTRVDTRNGAIKTVERYWRGHEEDSELT